MTSAWRAILLFIAFAGAAQAQPWHEARTDHFVLVMRGEEAETRSFAERLERFDAALRLLYNLGDDKDLHARPVRVYALKHGPFQKVCQCYGVVGYYSSKLAAPRIVSLSDSGLDKEAETGDLGSLAVLLHEYSHHFMLFNFPTAYPYWYREGFAEFNANVKFEDDAVIIGYPANYRGRAIHYATSQTVERIVAPEKFGWGSNPDIVYGRAWLLTHYLMLSTQRRGQLKSYLSAVAAGKDSLTSAEAAFGDLKVLNAQLDSYQRGRLHSPLRIPTPVEPSVAVRRLDAAEAEMLIPYVTMTDGVPEGYRLGVRLEAGRVARKHPTSALVQQQAGEVSLLADRPDDAVAYADKALAIAPAMQSALLLKGKALLVSARRASKAGGKGDWAGARQWLARANRSDPNHAEPLYVYYQSFVDAGETPTALAVKGLRRASVLAPDNSRISTALAWQALTDGDSATARTLLAPIAFSPHGRTNRQKWSAIVTLIKAGKTADARTALKALIDQDD